MRLTGDRDAAALAARARDIVPHPAASDARADRLERAVHLRTGRWDLAVAVEADHPPATITRQDGRTTITVAADRSPQPLTDHPPAAWTFVVQRVRLLHEAAHLEHSDVGDLRTRLESVPDGYRPVTASIWNALEDAAIEAAIAARWPNYEPWLRIVRQNLLAAIGPGVSHPDGGRVHHLVGAAVLAIMDGTVLEPGPLAALLDPTDDTRRFHSAADRERFVEGVLPAIASAKRDLGAAESAVDRNRIAIDCAEAIRPAIEAAGADGRAQAAAWRGAFWGWPDDAAHDPFVGDGAPLPEGAQIVSDDHGGGSDARTGSGATAESAPVETDEESPEDPQTRVPPEDGSPDLVETLAAEQTHGESVEERTATLERLDSAVAAAESDLEESAIVVPDDAEPHEPTAAAAAADGARLARVLSNRFQTDRSRSIDRHRRRGRLDSAALHRHALGDRRVKQRLDRPDDPDRRCLLVLDRSGSMRQHVRVAERAMGMLAVALEAVDVPVTVLELLDKTVRLAKPADRPVDRARGRLYHGDVGGGTPLTDALHLARETEKRTSERSFLVVVTDGRPADPERYRAALNRFTVPVVGVNLTTDRAAGESEFHRQVTVPPETERLRRALRQLVQEVLFE